MDENDNNNNNEPFDYKIYIHRMCVYVCVYDIGLVKTIHRIEIYNVTIHDVIFFRSDIFSYTFVLSRKEGTIFAMCVYRLKHLFVIVSCCCCCCCYFSIMLI